MGLIYGGMRVVLCDLEGNELIDLTEHVTGYTLHPDDSAAVTIRRLDVELEIPAAKVAQIGLDDDTDAELEQMRAAFTTDDEPA